MTNVFGMDGFGDDNSSSDNSSFESEKKTAKQKSDKQSKAKKAKPVNSSKELEVKIKKEAARKAEREAKRAELEAEKAKEKALRALKAKEEAEARRAALRIKEEEERQKREALEKAKKEAARIKAEAIARQKAIEEEARRLAENKKERLQREKDARARAAEMAKKADEAKRRADAEAKKAHVEKERADMEALRAAEILARANGEIANVVPSTKPGFFGSFKKTLSDMSAAKAAKKMAKDKKTKSRNFLSIDLGTANTVAFAENIGIFWNEPTILAYDLLTGEVVEHGEQAYKMLGKTHKNLKIVTPLKKGKIVDDKAMEDLIKLIFEKAKKLGVLKNSSAIISVPSNVSEIQKTAISITAQLSGASFAYVDEEVKLAALGGGIKLELPEARLVIDMGGGTTNIAILGSGNIINAASIDCGGKLFDKTIVEYMQKQHKLTIGWMIAEKIKTTLGSLEKQTEQKKFKVFGRHTDTGLPAQVVVTSEEIRKIITPLYTPIITRFNKMIETCPPEVASDIFEKGALLTGGGMLMDGLQKYLQKQFKFKTTLASNPLLCTINGGRKQKQLIFDYADGKKQILDSADW